MVIRMRHTRAHSGNRRSHHALTAENTVVCAHCGASRRPHHMCLSCGYYNGRQVMDLAGEKAKRDARLQAKREKITNEATSSMPAIPKSAESSEVSTKDEHKKAREENKETTHPEMLRDAK